MCAWRAPLFDIPYTYAFQYAQYAADVTAEWAILSGLHKDLHRLRRRLRTLESLSALCGGAAPNSTQPAAGAQLERYLAAAEMLSNVLIDGAASATPVQKVLFSNSTTHDTLALTHSYYAPYTQFVWSHLLTLSVAADS